MTSFQIKLDFKQTHPLARLPERAHQDRKPFDFEIDNIFIHEDGVAQGTGDTGYDIFSVEECIIPARGNNVVKTGIQLAYIEPGYWFRIEARSGLGFKHSVFPHAGIIDNCYRGDLAVKLYNLGDKDYQVNVGDRIAQLVLYMVIGADINWSDDVIDTNRGGSRLGSTGK